MPEGMWIAWFLFAVGLGCAAGDVTTFKGAGIGAFGAAMFLAYGIDAMVRRARRSS